MATLILVVLVALLCVGCASASSVRYPVASYTPTSPDSIPIYYNFPPVQYEVIGEVKYDGAPAARWSGAEKLMRAEAAKIGGDAIVIQEKEQPLRGALLSGSTIGLAREKAMRGVVIKYQQ